MESHMRQVTLALCITGVITFTRSVFIFVSQIVGAIAAAAVIKGIIPGDEILFNVELSAGTAIVQGLFLEMFLTAELVFTILMLAAEVSEEYFLRSDCMLTNLENKSYVRCTCRHWSCSVRGRTCRSLLDRRCTEPSASFWACCCPWFISRISLDLLFVLFHSCKYIKLTHH
jgi:hypothetical protein